MKDKVKTWITTLVTISIIFMCIACVSILLAKEPEDDNVEGTYNLISITGTQNISATKYNNYLTLKNGVCTLHLSLSNPAGSSTHTFYYTGNTWDSIKFESTLESIEIGSESNSIKVKKSYIYMTYYENNIVIMLDYDNGYYNDFTYKKPL
jgi:hypothetical protein